MSGPVRLVHLSDIHVWRITANPAHLFNKRILGVMDLLRGRARRFRLERLQDVVGRVKGIEPDHILITGDLTTTAFAAEFVAALEALQDLLVEPERVTVVPGNHDRYTRSSMRNRQFEAFFGRFMPAPEFPWIRWAAPGTAILGLDPTRSHLSARGFLSPLQMEAADALLREQAGRFERLIVACHYPAAAPAEYARELALKRLSNEARVRTWLAGLPTHLYCCGHVHAAWAFTPAGLPRELCLNAGAPLLRDRHGLRQPGFLEIVLDGPAVKVTHHAWNGQEWQALPMMEHRAWFGPEPA